MSEGDQARKRPVSDDTPGPSKKWRQSRECDSISEEESLDFVHTIDDSADEADLSGMHLPALIVTTHESAVEPFDINEPGTSGTSRVSEPETSPPPDPQNPTGTTKPPNRLKIKLPDSEPGPSGVKSSRPGSEAEDAQGAEADAWASGFLPPFLFDRSRPFKDRSELAKSAPYNVGRGYSNYFELNALEDMVRESRVFLSDAASVRTMADQEENLLSRATGYLRAIAVYIVAGETLEGVENHPRRALETYQQARALVGDAYQILIRTSESVSRTRLRIIYVRVESWLEYRMCRLRKKLSSDETYMAQQVRFCRVVGNMKSLGLGEAAPPVESDLTLQQRTNILESRILQKAFDSWCFSVKLISDSREDDFFMAVECALLKYVSMHSDPRLFSEYIREFVSRIERFKD